MDCYGLGVLGDCHRLQVGVVVGGLGGALEVGKASTTSFVWTSVVIILLNYILTQMLLS